MKLASWDLETALRQPGLGAPPIVCASVANDTGCHLLDPVQTLAWLRKVLARGDHIVGCNVAYDFVTAAAADPSLLPLIFAAYDADLIHDIAIREALIDIAKGDLIDHGDEGVGIRYGMRILAQRHLGLDLTADKKAPDAWRKKYATLANVPIVEWEWAARVYPLRDVAYPLAIFKLQEGGENLHDEPHQTRAAFALQLMSVWGIRSNRESVAALRKRVEAQDLANTIDFRAHGILRADGSENRAKLAEIITAAYQGDPPRTAPSTRFPQGQVSSDRDTLVESGDPLLERYGRAGKNDKYLTTYLPILEQGIDQPWNPSFNVLVATTRVSSDAQQFPQKGGVRECWEARPGHVFCSVDFGGLELRTMAQRAINDLGYSRMAEVLNSGLDAHLVAAASFLGITYDEAKRRYKLDEPLMIVMRDLGKVWNFGKGGGMGPGAMVYNARAKSNSRFCLLLDRAKTCGETKVKTKVAGKWRRICTKCLDVANELDDGWLRAWPEQKALFERASRIAKDGARSSVTIPVSNVKRGKCGYTQILNTPFQGLGAAATKRAMWIVCREMYADPASPLWGARLVLNVHDELIAEMPLETAPEAGDRMAWIMRETLKEYVPALAASVEAEPALSLTMAKGAKTVRDAAGRLQVWQYVQSNGVVHIVPVPIIRGECS